MVAIAAAYRKGRRSVPSSLENFPPYQRPVWHPPLYEQHRSFRELSPKTQEYPAYRQRSNRQDISPRPEQFPFRDQPYQDYPSHRYRPYYEIEPSSFKNVSDFHGPSSYLADTGSSYRYQQERDQIPFFRNKQPSYQYRDDRQSFRDDYRFADQYDKPINHYKEQFLGQQQVESFGRDPEYLKHGKLNQDRFPFVCQIDRCSFKVPFLRFFETNFPIFYLLEKDAWIFEVNRRMKWFRIR